MPSGCSRSTGRGRQSEALEAYRDARSTLVEQVGVEPGARAAGAARAGALAGSGARPRAAAREPRRRPRARRRAAGAGCSWPPARCCSPASSPSASSASSSRTACPASTRTPSALIDRGSGRITAQYSVGRGPQAVAAGAGSVWVANRLDGTVSRIDRGRDEVVTIHVGGEPTGLAFGAGSLWVADGQGRTRRPDRPGSQQGRAADRRRQRRGRASPPATARSGSHPRSTPPWCGSTARSGKAGRSRSRSQARPSALAAGAGSIWVASEDDGERRPARPALGRAAGQHPRGQRAERASRSAPARSGWRTAATGPMSRIDPGSEVADRRRAASGASRAPSRPTATASGWPTPATETVMRIDRAQPPGDQGPSTSGAAPRRWRWSTARCGPPRSRPPPRTAAARCASPLRRSGEPSRADFTAWQPRLAASLVYDGLVAYRRAGGAAGADARRPTSRRSCPSRAPTAGRTASGCARTSASPTARPSRPRTSARRSSACSRSGTGYYDELERIPGAATCADRGAFRARSLRRTAISPDGVETDDAARAVTIHLSQAGRRLPAQAVKPVRRAGRQPGQAGQHADAAGHRAVRGQALGPAAAAGCWCATRTSRSGRPIGPTASPTRSSSCATTPVRAQIAAVEDGAADIAVGRRHDAGATQVRARYGAAAAHRPDRGDAVRVPQRPRRRRSTTGACGGRSTTPSTAAGSPSWSAPRRRSKPTCQLLPPGFQGYTPACPFTARPQPRRHVDGPRPGRARRLVAASGTRGMKVEFWGARGFEPFGRYFRIDPARDRLSRRAARRSAISR